MTPGEVAVEAARSLIGNAFEWNSADPKVGISCGGLIVYAWRAAGVALPLAEGDAKTAALLYETLPQVDRADVAPGDVLFLYRIQDPERKVVHCVIHTGRGRMIEATQPGVQPERDVPAHYWARLAGIGRPG